MKYKKPKLKIKINNRMKEYGNYDTKTGLLQINKAKHNNKKELADSVKHELTHRVHPQWSEKKVANSTPQLKNQSKQMENTMLAKLKSAPEERRKKINQKKGALKRKFHMKSDEKIVPGSFIRKFNENKGQRITRNNQSGSNTRNIMNMM